MPIRDLKAQIARLPEQPGVYVFVNAAGDIKQRAPRYNILLRDDKN
jgi:excinuclease UvrABC nuclease subunit